MLLLSSFVTWSRDKFPSRIRIFYLIVRLTIRHKFRFLTSQTSISSKIQHVFFLNWNFFSKGWFIHGRGGRNSNKQIYVTGWDMPPILGNISTPISVECIEILVGKNWDKTPFVSETWRDKTFFTPDQCLQNVGFFGPHHVPIWEKHMQTWRVSVSALLYAAVTSFV